MSEDIRLRKIFTHATDIKLIRLVQQHTILYDGKHDKYLDQNTKEVAWQKIGDELKKSPSACKARWVNMRDAHRRFVRKQMQNPALAGKKYKYQDELKFMRQYYKDLPYPGEDEEETANETSYTNYEDPTDQPYDSESDSTHVIQAIPVPVVKEEKKSRKRKKISSEPTIFAQVSEPTEFDLSDPLDNFLRTIGATLKTFTPYRLNLAKTQIFSIVQEHELQQILQNGKNDTDEGET